MKAKFQKIGQVYQVLADCEKRATYDRYGEAGLDHSFKLKCIHNVVQHSCTIRLLIVRVVEQIIFVSSFTTSAPTFVLASSTVRSQRRLAPVHDSAFASYSSSVYSSNRCDAPQPTHKRCNLNIIMPSCSSFLNSSAPFTCDAQRNNALTFQPSPIAIPSTKDRRGRRKAQILVAPSRAYPEPAGWQGPSDPEFPPGALAAPFPRVTPGSSNHWCIEYCQGSANSHVEFRLD